MSKKILLIGFVLFALVIMACHFFRFPPLIKAKANWYYGTKVCRCDVGEIGLPVVTIHFCPLCYRIERRGTNTGNTICYECSKIAGICEECCGIKTDLPIFTIDRVD